MIGASPADKPYAKLIQSVLSCEDGQTIAGMLKAAQKLPSERSMMMLAAGVAALACKGRPDTPEFAAAMQAIATIEAFIEEARWRAL